MRVVRKHEEQVFIILAGDHGIASVDAPGEEGHAFVLYCPSVEGESAKIKKVGGFEQLRKNRATVVGRISRVIHDAAVVLDETDEAGILHAVAFIGGDGK